MACTVLEAVPFSVGKLQGADLRGLAGLPKSQDAADEPQQDTEAEEPQTPHQIRQQMTLAIERSIAQAAQQAKEAIQQRVQQGLQEARRVLKKASPAIFIDVYSPGRPLLDTHLQAIELLRERKVKVSGHVGQVLKAVREL